MSYFFDGAEGRMSTAWPTSSLVIYHLGSCTISNGRYRSSSQLIVIFSSGSEHFSPA